jgi:hypothetical protein
MSSFLFYLLFLLQCTTVAVANTLLLGNMHGNIPIDTYVLMDGTSEAFLADDVTLLIAPDHFVCYMGYLYISYDNHLETWTILGMVSMADGSLEIMFSTSGGIDLSIWL